MTIDHNALASDLEQLGLKAIAGAVRRDSISVERALASVNRTRETVKLHIGDQKRAALAQEILDRYQGDGAS